MQFIKTIQNFAQQYELLPKGSKIIIGVSGGPDSVCLLDVLVFLSVKYDFQLLIAHVNYGLRGKDSLADEKYAIDLGKKYGIEVNVLNFISNKNNKKSESVLRDARYEYFEKLRVENKFDLIAVAHNKNDQAETVLLKLFRGSGLNGLGAMKPKSGKLIRPLLDTDRDNILAYLKEKKIEFRTDKSNAENNFTRNKVRNKLLPYLEKEFNPSIINTLSQASYMIADDYDFISKSAERFAKSACKNKQANFMEQDFLVLDASLQRQVLRQIYNFLSGSSSDFESSHIEEFRKVIKSGKSKTKNAVIGGLKVSKKGDKIKIFC